MENAKRKPGVFQVDDVVRVSKIKLTFQKGYEPKWTEELFVVTECVPRDPPVYRIQDLLGKPIQGTFYSHELHKLQLKEKYTIEKTVKKRTRKDHVEYKINFNGYPNEFNQWIKKLLIHFQ